MREGLQLGWGNPGSQSVPPHLHAVPARILVSRALPVVLLHCPSRPQVAVCSVSVCPLVWGSMALCFRVLPWGASGSGTLVFHRGPLPSSEPHSSCFLGCCSRLLGCSHPQILSFQTY